MRIVDNAHHRAGLRQTWFPRLWVIAAIAGALLAQPLTTRAEKASLAPPTLTRQTALQHDGQHDFDFLLGSWKIHLKKLLHPLSGSAEWVEFDGTVVCRKVWDGRAELEEFNVESPEQHIHIQGLALRLYNPESHQWSIYWGNSAKGSLDFPPMIGEFKDGRGEFYDQELVNGRAIFVRYAWTNVTSNAPHFEQSYSTDGGKTWEVNWITEQSKEKP
jgi:hypothetical protein